MLVCDRMTERDVEAAAHIEKESFPDAWSVKALLDMLKQPQYFAEVSREDGKINGYVIAYTVLDECELVKIAVDKKVRRRGVGEQLLRKLFEHCSENGITKILLDVREGNKSAIAFYKKNGFTEDGIRKNFYEFPRENGVLMSRKIFAK